MGYWFVSISIHTKPQRRRSSPVSSGSLRTRLEPQRPMEYRGAQGRPHVEALALGSGGAGTSYGLDIVRVATHRARPERIIAQEQTGTRALRACRGLRTV
jgi:hypothetical protein